MDILSWISFGKVSAERDDELIHYFFDSGVLKSVIDSPTSFLVLGRKGAGKTAVFRFLSENPYPFIGKDNILVPLSFDDYNWNIHSQLVNPQKAESLTYRQSWKYVIYTECIKAAKLWHENKGTPVPTTIKKACDLLEKLYGTPIPSLSSVIGKKLLNLASFRLPKIGANIEDGSIGGITLEGGEITFEQLKTEHKLKEQLSDNIEILIEFFETAIINASKDLPIFYICFDRVDEAWDEVSYEVSKRVIAGLVSASDAITAHINKTIRPIVFLREDIFETLSINDANKLREDCGALLSWNRADLNNLILKRINHFANKNGIEPISNIESLFDRQEMRQRARPLNYILKRTMMRPRDIITFLNRIILAMKEKVNDPFSEEAKSFDKLEVESIYAAEPGYSDWLKQEIIDEWKVQKPIIKVALDAIQNNGSTNITQAQLVTEISKLDGEFQEAEINSILKFLYEISILGFKVGESFEWKYKCFYPSQGFIESDEYKLHDGLIRSLNVKEPRERLEA